MQDKHKKPGYYSRVDQEGRIYSRQVCFMRPGANVPGHPCLGANRVTDFDGFFSIREIVEHIGEAGLKPQVVAFDEIWNQSHGEGERDWIVDNDPRYKAADVSFPGILSPLQNPDSKPLRMLDGRRRMWKRQADGETSAPFYVLSEDEVFRFFWMIVSQDTFVQQVGQLEQRK